MAGINSIKCPLTLPNILKTSGGQKLPKILGKFKKMFFGLPRLA
jgi:hypothetical protein